MPQHRVCPWWLGYLLLGPVRRYFHDPTTILARYVEPGMTVLEPGPGMGFFTLEIARLVGPEGHVVAVEIQPKMCAALRRRARGAGLDGRIDARVVGPDSMDLQDLSDRVVFVFAFAVVHEMPSAARFYAETAGAVRSGGKVFVVEPAGHVSDADFAEQKIAAAAVGLTEMARPSFGKHHSALFQKP